MSQYQWNWSVVLEQVSGTEEFYYQWLLSGLGWSPLNLATLGLLALALLLVVSGPRQATTA